MGDEDDLEKVTISRQRVHRMSGVRFHYLIY